MADAYDVIVVGGGHNGLVAAAYLARAGRRVVVCERRHTVGGAAVSEHPFGPDFTVTSLSYVVSLLPQEMVRDLGLAEHGYHVYPQGPYFAPRRDGRYLALPDEPADRYKEISKFSTADAEAYEKWDAWMGRLGGLVGPLLSAIPPKLGSKKARDLLGQAALAARLRKVDVRAAFDLTRLFTASVADLVEDRFESEAVRGVLSVSGVIGTWAGPRSAGTAYVMLHHHIGETTWGFPRGGMGGVTQAMARAATAFGAEIRLNARVASIDVGGGRVRGVTLESGDALSAPVVITTAHPKISFLRLVERSQLPADFVADIESWQTRSGTVKVNFAVDRLPTFAAHPEFDPSIYGGTIVLAESLDDIEGAYQEAVAGRAATLPFADVCIPSVFDDTLAPAGKHIVSAFTQWVPHGWAREPHPNELETYADRLTARMEAVAPGFTESIIGRQVIGPDTMEREYGLVGGNIFHGELTPGQMFHCRPAAGYADLRTPVRGLYQAGSATHGGGGVTGIPGRNVVHQILTDQRRVTGARSARAA
jgi:phytoene dehydrogenase-like protein